MIITMERCRTHATPAIYPERVPTPTPSQRVLGCQCKKVARTTTAPSGRFLFDNRGPTQWFPFPSGALFRQRSPTRLSKSASLTIFASPRFFPHQLLHRVWIQLLICWGTIGNACHASQKVRHWDRLLVHVLHCTRRK